MGPKRFVNKIIGNIGKRLYLDQGYSVLFFEPPEENKSSRERMCSTKEILNFIIGNVAADILVQCQEKL